MFCAVCGAPVYKSEKADAWFHDVYPRWLASIARKVTDKSATAPAPRKTMTDLSLPRLP